MMAVGCQRAFAARTAVTRFERHLVADIFCEPHETKILIEIPPFYIDTLLRTRKDFQNNNNNKAKLRPALYMHTNEGKNQYWAIPAHYNDNIFLKHRKKRSSGGSTVSSADDGRWMSTGICRSIGRYQIQAPSSGRYFP
jgi:hypothetical protein